MSGLRPGTCQWTGDRNPGAVPARTEGSVQSGARPGGRGQVLALFALVLLVLLGVAALSIDYASWLLTDRYLQNVADHAALAGASAFGDRTTQGSCSGGSGQAKCRAARAQAWASINDELKLGLSDDAITQLAMSDSGTDGTTTATDSSGNPFSWQDRVWVTTPPPTYPAYTAPAVGGKYAQNFGIVFARVDRDVPSFLAGALGVRPQPRHGWATAGALPTGYALQTFCRNNIAPQTGVCENSAGLTIDGQGGIRLLTGDIASNESVKVSATNGGGVTLDAGNLFLVNGTCSSATWRCPNGPPSLGGISDGSTGKNAFYMAPLPVPHYATALDFAPLSTCQTPGQWAANPIPCVPFQSQSSAHPTTPGDWICGDGITACGIPTVTTVSGTSTVSCGAGVYDPASRFLRPNLDQSVSQWTGSPNTTALYENLKDPTVDPAGTLPATTPGSAPLTGSPADQVYSDDGRSPTLRVGLTPPQGIPNGGNLSVRYVLYKKVGAGTPSSDGNAVSVTVQLEEKTGSNTYTLRGPQQVHTNIDGTITVYQYNVSMSLLPSIASYNKLYLRFDVSTTRSTGGSAGNNRGAAVTWGEVEIPELLPPTPPTVKPGYWHSITIPDGGCAILDPSPSIGLQQFQVPGIYRFGGSNGVISIGSDAFLIGDAVSLFFDQDWPDPTGGRGISIGGNGALVLNTAISGGYNPSYPLISLPRDAVSAGWQVNPAGASGVHAGTNLWPVCTQGGNDCVPRDCYMNTDPTQCDGDTVTPIDDGRGITFYFTPAQWPATSIRGRFQNGGGSGAQPGIAFRGVLYAPYDDVKISGANGFSTVGQVLSWTAKFNGGSAYIYLEYPYRDEPADPYLLEPTIDH